MRIVKIALLVLAQAALSITVGPAMVNAHNGVDDADAPEQWDFSSNGTSCRWVGGPGQGLECQGSDGAGFSASCDFRPDLCQAGQGQKETKTQPKPQEEPQEPKQRSGSSFINNKGDACEVLITGSVACFDKNGKGYLVSQGQITAGDGTSVFKSKDGFTCEKTADGGLECEKRDKNGNFINGFSSTCELRPDLCQQAKQGSGAPPASAGKNKNAGAIEPSVGITATQPPSGSDQDGLPDNDSIAANNGLNTPSLPTPPSTNDALQGLNDSLGLSNNGKDGNALSPDSWMNRSGSELEQAGSRINGMIEAAKTGVKTALSMLTLNRLRMIIKHAFFHQVSRTQVIRRLPPKYYAQDGIFEKPKQPDLELDLVAHGSYDALVRDVSIGEECLGGAPGASAVRHVDMIAQCGQLPFGERRRFKI
ncbi:MAG: hypothetical protein AAB091_02040 [Elusimicrobiota bacterium]